MILNPSFLSYCFANSEDTKQQQPVRFRLVEMQLNLKVHGYMICNNDKHKNDKSKIYGNVTAIKNI